MLAAVLQVAGAAAITVGVGVVFWPAAVVCAGVFSILFGLALARSEA